jgi:imidazolonepropionase
MLIHSASQVLTLSGGPQRGNRLGELHIIENGAVLIRGEKIEAVGSTPELLSAFPAEEKFDAQGCAILPGFVDPHTHLVWAGDRAAEFEMRLEGKTYLEIQAAGGGIVSTVRATRQAGTSDLTAQTRGRALRMFRNGTTTAEAKTGYGLDIETEQRMMQVILDLNREGPLELVPTWLGAHAIAPEYGQDADGYTAFLITQALPAVKAWWLRHAERQPFWKPRKSRAFP